MPVLTPSPPAATARSAPVRRALPRLLVVACLVAVTGCGADDPAPAHGRRPAEGATPQTSGAPATSPAPSGREPGAVLAGPGARRAATVLGRWDAARSRAWRAGDPDTLASLYTDGSLAGRRDVRALQAWVRRGVRLDGADLRLLALRVLRRPGLGVARWRLDVTDVLRPARAVAAHAIVALPRDRASRHEVTLVRVRGRWRVGDVIAHRPG